MAQFPLIAFQGSVAHLSTVHYGPIITPNILKRKKQELLKKKMTSHTTYMSAAAFYIPHILYHELEAILQ